MRVSSFGELTSLEPCSVAIRSTGVRHISSNALMVRFGIKPAYARATAASCAAAKASLLYCLVIALHPDDRSNRLRRRETRSIQCQILVGKQPKGCKLVPTEDFAADLGETVNKIRQCTMAE